MTAGGAVYAHPMSERRITGTGGFFWQTPVADDSVSREKGKMNSRGEPKLSVQVKIFPTPTSRDYKGIGKSRMDRTGSKSGECLPQAIGGMLNPDWCGWLMGFPIGWASLKATETRKSHYKPQPHGDCSGANE